MTFDVDVNREAMALTTSPLWSLRRESCALSGGNLSLLGMWPQRSLLGSHPGRVTHEPSEYSQVTQPLKTAKQKNMPHFFKEAIKIKG